MSKEYQHSEYIHWLAELEMQKNAGINHSNEEHL